jgi:hypothetical protein
MLVPSCVGGSVALCVGVLHLQLTLMSDQHFLILIIDNYVKVHMILVSKIFWILMSKENPSMHK